MGQAEDAGSDEAALRRDVEKLCLRVRGRGPACCLRSEALCLTEVQYSRDWLALFAILARTWWPVMDVEGVVACVCGAVGCHDDEDEGGCGGAMVRSQDGLALMYVVELDDTWK